MKIKVVKETRELMAKYFDHIPYGANVGNRKSDNTMLPVTDEDGDGYYDLDVSWWPEGVYRLNYHSVPGQESPHGSSLSTERDHDVSWPKWLDAIDEESKPFLHEEKNGAGFCFRILIRPDRTIEAF